MKFRVKNEFIYKGIRKYPGEVIEIAPAMINRLKSMNVLGEPVVEKDRETATKKPKEVRGKKKK